MPKGFTYTATDSHGTRHARYTAGHAKPTYAYAVVNKGHDMSDNYCSRKDLAQAEMARRAKFALTKGYPVDNFEILILDAKPGNVRTAFLAGSID